MLLQGSHSRCASMTVHKFVLIRSRIIKVSIPQRNRHYTSNWRGSNFLWDWCGAEAERNYALASSIGHIVFLRISIHSLFGGNSCQADQIKDAAIIVPSRNSDGLFRSVHASASSQWSSSLCCFLTTNWPSIEMPVHMGPPSCWKSFQSTRAFMGASNLLIFSDAVQACISPEAIDLSC